MEREGEGDGGKGREKSREGRDGHIDSRKIDTEAQKQTQRQIDR